MLNSTILSNGVHLIAEEIRYTKSFALGFYLKIGSANTKSEKIGIAHALEHLVFRRSANTDDIIEKFENLGAYINAFTSNEYTCFYVRALGNKFNECFSLLSELVFRMQINEDDFEKEKEIILEEIKAAKDEPEEYIFDIADELIFGDHQLGYSILGSEDSINKLSLKDVERYYRDNYTCDNLVVVSAGDIPYQSLCEATEKITTGKMKKKITNIQPLPEKFFENKGGELIANLPLTQSHFLFGRFIKIESIQVASLSSIIIGDGMSSRLYQNIREKYSLCYNIYSSVQSYSQCQIFYIYTSTMPKKKERLIEKLNKEFSKIALKGISNEELARAKAMLSSGFVMEMEDLSSRIHYYAKNLILYSQILDIDATLAEFEIIPLEKVNDFNNNLFADGKWFQTVLEKGKRNK